MLCRFLAESAHGVNPNLVTRFEDAELGILHKGLDTRPCPAAVCFCKKTPEGTADANWSHVDSFFVFEKSN